MHICYFFLSMSQNIQNITGEKEVRVVRYNWGFRRVVTTASWNNTVCNFCFFIYFTSSFLSFYPISSKSSKSFPLYICPSSPPPLLPFILLCLFSLALLPFVSSSSLTSSYSSPPLSPCKLLVIKLCSVPASVNPKLVSAATLDNKN